MRRGRIFGSTGNEKQSGGILSSALDRDSVRLPVPSLSKVDARPDLAAAGARELVEALSRGDASESAQSLRRVVGVGNGHIGTAQVDVVQEVDERDFDSQLGAFAEVEALRQGEVPVDSPRALDDADA